MVGKSNSQSHEVHVYVVNGSRVAWSEARLAALLRSPGFLIFSVVFGLVLALQTQQPFGFRASFAFRAGLLAVVITLLVGIYYLQFIALNALARRIGRTIKVISPLLYLLPVGTIVTASGMFTAWYHGAEDILEPLGAWDFIQNYILVLIFEFFVITWLVPETSRGRSYFVADTPGPDGLHAGVPSPEGRSARIMIAEKDFALDDLLYLKSDGHYLQVVTENGGDFVRARMAEVTGGADDDWGVQTHRSFWVAGHAIAGHRHVDGQAHLVLTNGDRVPIARNRRPAVAAWLERNGRA